MRIAGTLLAVGIVMALGAAPALASRAEIGTHVESCPKAMCSTTYFETATYVAAPGEANAVTVRTEADAVVFTDPATVVQPGNACDRVDDHTVRCRFSASIPGVHVVRSTVVDAGDGADSIDATAYAPPSAPLGFATIGAAALGGGPGDDRITGGPGGDVLRGGPGADQVLGGDGDDILGDAEGEAAAGADTFDGGAGIDRLEYTDRKAAVVVDLGAGAGDGGDRVTAIEGVTGGAAADDLRGGPGDDALAGGEGDDLLRGGDGADRLTGDAGANRMEGEGGNDVLVGEASFRGPRDHFSGGDGDDVILSHDDRAEVIRCGAGVDSVSGAESLDRSPDPGDVLMADCERVGTQQRHPVFSLPPTPSRYEYVEAQPVRVTARRVTLRAPCRCRAGAELRVGRRVIGRVGMRPRVRNVSLNLRSPIRRRTTLRIAWTVREKGYSSTVTYAVRVAPS
jgi:Ca2+-binding RTX toxin-like protein